MRDFTDEELEITELPEREEMLLGIDVFLDLFGGVGLGSGGVDL